LIPTNIAYYIRDDIRGGFGRSSSIFGQPIAYGFYLIILFYFYIFLLKQGMLKRSWYIVLNIVHIIAIFLTISRSIWVAFIISLIFFTSLWGFRRKSYFAQILPVILIGTLLLFPLSRGKLYDFTARSFSSHYEESSNIRSRIGMIKDASIVVRGRYLTGLGPGYPWHTREQYIWEGYDFHSYENTFLFLFLESGLLGLFSFILFILASLNWNYKMARKAKALPEIRLFISSVFSILVSYLIMTLTVNVFGFYNLQHMIMVVLAFAIIIISNRKDLHSYYQRSY
jgi:O-antigen ligase